MAQPAQNRIPGLQVKAEARQRHCMQLLAKLPERLSWLPYSLYHVAMLQERDTVRIDSEQTASEK